MPDSILRSFLLSGHGVLSRSSDTRETQLSRTHTPIATKPSPAAVLSSFGEIQSPAWAPTRTASALDRTSAAAAGLTGAVASTALVVTAGLAEIAAGSIAMGLGGYLAGKSDVEHYASERQREQLEIEQKPDVEAMEVMELLQSHGLTPEESAPVVAALRRRPEAWRDFMLRFELGLEKPDPRRAVTSGAVIAAAYVGGGLIPLCPYMLLPSAQSALLWS